MMRYLTLFWNNSFPLEHRNFLPCNKPDELGVPVAGAGLSGMKLPTFQPATVAFCDIAPQGENDSDEHYTARVELAPTYLAIDDGPPVWTRLEGEDLARDPFFGRMVSDTLCKD